MRPYRGRFQHPNEPETGVNLRQHVIHTDTDGCAMKTGERGDDGPDVALDGYQVIARRPRSETVTDSVEPEKADMIEEFSRGLYPLDRW